MADRAPDEIISEILSGLLKHPDEVFSDYSEKPLLARYSSSTYLLVCKAWLRVSTPLLYNVVILRTTAQAEALAAVLQSNKEFGLFIRKLRVEGGFGKAMHTILKYAPNISDLFLTLSIWGSDKVGGLCSGLPLINPRRVILVDHGAREIMQRAFKPRKNKEITQLLGTLVKLIPKWALVTFDFPYVATDMFGSHSTYNERAEALASALAESKTLHTLFVCAGDSFPRYLHQMRDLPSLVAIQLTFGAWPQNASIRELWLKNVRSGVDEDPKLKALVKYDAFDPYMLQLADQEHLQKIRMQLSALTQSSFAPEITRASDIQTLEKLGETLGSTLQQLLVTFVERQGPVKFPTQSPTVLKPFSALTHLTWSSPQKCPFSKPAPDFSALPNLQKLMIRESSPSFLEVLSKLSLDALQEVFLDKPLDVAASVNFLRRHGAKLLQLTAPLEILATVKVFTALPEDFITCSPPHTSLTKIHFDLRRLERQHKYAIKEVFARLDTTSFPVLKEIQVSCAKWPVSEQEIRKSEWVALSKVLRPKGIKLTDENGVDWTPR
ncbi:hypothetical protein C8R44DRAFT_764254 [Mycena epipterygia]|nr:hypothetical protein C8R44DRAFT_764254 [Mycena epipterygia]